MNKASARHSILPSKLRCQRGFSLIGFAIAVNTAVLVGAVSSLLMSEMAQRQVVASTSKAKADEGAKSTILMTKKLIDSGVLGVNSSTGVLKCDSCAANNNFVSSANYSPSPSPVRVESDFESVGADGTTTTSTTTTSTGTTSGAPVGGWTLGFSDNNTKGSISFTTLCDSSNLKISPEGRPSQCASTTTNLALNPVKDANNQYKNFRFDSSATIGKETKSLQAQVKPNFSPAPLQVNKTLGLRGPSDGGSLVTLTTTGTFPVGTTATVDGVACTNGARTSASSSFTCAVPKKTGSASEVIIAVTTPDGSTNNENKFTYLDPPTIGLISPATGPDVGQNAVTINGTNFIPGTSIVKFGTNEVPQSDIDAVASTDQKIEVKKVPGHAAGFVDVVVKNPNDQILGILVNDPAGQVATKANGYSYSAAAPSISNLSPSNGAQAGGNFITVNGDKFQNGATVLVDGTARPTTFNNTNSLQVQMPLHAAGNAVVTVRNPDNQVSSGANYNYLNAAPSIITLSSSSGLTTGGGTITISGTNFQSGASVIFDSTSMGATFINSGSLTVTVPGHAAGAVLVKAVNPDSQESNSVGYTYNPVPQAPTIANLSPNLGPIAGGTVVTINGADFQSGAQINWDGTLYPTTFVNTGKLTFTSKNRASTGSISAFIKNPDNQTSNNMPFNYTNNPPKITSVSPVTGLATGGWLVTINGSDFQSGPSIDFNATPGNTITWVSAAKVTVKTPAMPVGTVATLNFRNSDGQSTSYNSISFTAPPPTLSSISPTSGSTTANTSVTINGSNFSNPAVVVFGGSDIATAFTSSSKLTITAPSRPAGTTVSLYVRNSDGQITTATKTLTYSAPAPVISSISPTSVRTGSSQLVDVYGSNFVSGQAKVYVGTSLKTTTFVDTGHLRFTMPSSSTVQTVSVSVKDNITLAQSGSLPFDYTSSGSGSNICSSTGSGSCSASPSAFCSPSTGTITGSCHCYSCSGSDCSCDTGMDISYTSCGSGIGCTKQCRNTIKGWAICTP